MTAALVRPATAADLAALSAWSPQATLPASADETLLVAQATAPDDEPPVLMGALRLRQAVGMALPRVWYHVGCTVHAASELNLFHRQRTLMLGHDHTGASELADITWARDDVAVSEQAATLNLLVQAALLVMASKRSRYAERLIAELPGPRDGTGQSPFWQGLGRHFFSGDPRAAAATHGAAWRTHVSALLPRQPVYTSFLPDAAQAAIAQVHPEALLLREVLEQAGLRYSHHVNVEDAGPVLEAPTDDLPSVRRARRWTLAESAQEGGAACLVLAGTTEGSWRAARVRAQAQGKVLAITAEALQALGAPVGASVWAAALGNETG